MNRRDIHYRNCKEITTQQCPALPSCLLTPESAEKPKDFGRITPIFDRSSSVFLSPPSSLERSSIPNFASPTLTGLPVLNLDVEGGIEKKDTSRSSLSRSPLLPEDRIIGGGLICRPKVDVVSELLALNCDRICKSICDCLSDSDLIRFTSVCKKWRHFVYWDSRIYNRWSTFLRERKQYCALKGQENLGSASSLKIISTSELLRTPLSNLDVNQSKAVGTLNKHRVNETRTSVTSSLFETDQTTPVTRELRPCPKCTSPSNYARMKNGHCQCQKCGLEYCSLCLRNMEHHASKICHGLPAPQERTDKKVKTRKTRSDHNSRKMKERLRRL